MTYSPKDYSNLIGLKGFSDQLLQNHFKLYQGYVTNTNKLNELLLTTDPTTPMYAELKRRFGWEFNGMRLHELYFENMSQASNGMNEALDVTKQIEEDFGSFENWKKDFSSTAAMRGIGWAILYYDFSAKRVFNVWINEHDVGHLAGGIPLVVLDVFEHAYMLDYGINRADYIKAFFDVLDWNAVDSRFMR
ncbi:MAG: Fe-Mn family superoxide dismutase [Candidatus Kerfeldbacteria bacterium]|nr:Fe-Mn family superoxide dismutase [Candidatus Kerfeldbacteria bacterium]